MSQAGAEFRVYASRALKEIEAGHMALADLSGLQSGKLTVGAFPTFLNTVVPAKVAVFSRAHPKAAIEVRDLRASQIEEQLLHGELDLGITLHPTEHAELETEPLFTAASRNGHRESALHLRRAEQYERNHRRYALWRDHPGRCRRETVTVTE